MQSTTKVSSERSAKLLQGRLPKVSPNPSRSNRNLPENQIHPHQGWIQFDEMHKN